MKTIKQKAVEAGLCKPYESEWQDDSNLVERYVKGITFCMEKNFITLEDMKPFKKELEENNVWCEQRVDHLLTADTYVYNECSGSLEIIDYCVSRAYIGLGSVLKITAKNNAILYIDAYHDSNIQIIVEDNAKISVSQYNNSSIQILKGVATITDRR